MHVKEKEIDIDINGKCNEGKFRVILNIDDILNKPSVNIPIDQRLRKDFGLNKKKKNTFRHKIKCKKNKTCKAKLHIPQNKGDK